MVPRTEPPEDRSREVWSPRRYHCRPIFVGSSRASASIQIVLALGGDIDISISTITSIKINVIFLNLLNREFIYIEKDSPLTVFSPFYSDFLFFSFFLKSPGSSPPSRSRLFCFSRAPCVILPEIGKE